MTVKELYEIAAAWGKEDAPLMLDYWCSDEWYAYKEPIERKEIKFKNDAVVIAIDNS